MHRHLLAPRRRTALVIAALVSAASVAALQTQSVAEARPLASDEPQVAKPAAKKPAAKKTVAKTTVKTSAKTTAKPVAKVTAATPAVAATHPAAKSSAPVSDGQQLYATTCAACHQAAGEGVSGVFPPLASSEWVTGDESRLVKIILHGITGPIEVEGETYSGSMPPWGGVLKDADVASMTTYIRSAWGNKAAPVTAAKVASIRAATAARKTPWTAAELK